MKTIAAKEAKNRFGQLIDDAQREPVTVEKNGRPFVVVQSYEDFLIGEQTKMENLREAIGEARNQFAQGEDKAFDDSAIDRIKLEGRRILAERKSGN